MPKGVLQSERMVRHILCSGIREIRIRAAVRYSGAPLFLLGIGSILYAVAGGCIADPRSSTPRPCCGGCSTAASPGAVPLIGAILALPGRSIRTRRCSR